MSDNPTRKGTREKKPPKHFDFDADFGNCSAPRPNEQRDRSNPAQENNQLAKLLCRFIQNSNQKYRESQQMDVHEKPPRHNENHADNEPRKENTLKRTELRSAQRDNEQAAPPAKRGKETVEKQAAEVRVNSRNEGGRKNGNPTRSNSTLNPAIQTDLAYHSILNQHIRNNYPDINHISAEMLRGLDIPRQPQDQPQPKPKTNPNKESRNAQSAKNNKEGELKPFKRQSYHVAVAYHIHLKIIKAKNRTEQEIDPTFQARKLRDDTYRQSQMKKARDDKQERDRQNNQERRR